MKICTKCKEKKSLDDFFNRNAKSGGKNSHCKSCERDQIDKWRVENKEAQAIIDRRCRLKRQYGITPEQYEELLEKQKGCCAICERHQSEFSIRLAIDHDHKTRRIRGLLCNYCNHRVVGRHTDGEKLRKIADYIEGGTDWFVPEKPKKKKRKKK